MRAEEFRALAKKLEATPHRKPPASEEHKIQCQCIKWFRLTYPKWHDNIFAIPNGGLRDKVTASKLKNEGELAGVADVQLALPIGSCCSLFIEFKTKTGYQSLRQKDWQQHIVQFNYIYVVVRSFDDFVQMIHDYLDGKLTVNNQNEYGKHQDRS